MNNHKSPSFGRFTLEQAKEMIEQDPASFQGYLVLGELLYNSKQFGEAVESLRSGIELLQKDLDNQAEGASHLGRFPMQMIKTLFHDASMMYGDCLIKSEQYEEASKVLRQGLKMDNARADGWNLLAIAQANSGNSNWATHSFRQAVFRDPSRKDLWSNLQISYQNLGRPEAEIIQQVLDGGGDMEEDLLILIDLLIGGGDYEDARTAIDMLRERESIKALIQISRLHLVEGDYKKTEKSLKKIIKSEKDNLQGLWNLARVLAIQGKKKEALKGINEILKISSNHSDALLLRDLLESDSGGKVKFGVFTYEEMETEPDDERTIHQYKVRPELYLPIGSTLEDAVHFLYKGEFFRFSDKKNMKYALMMIFQDSGGMRISCNAIPAPVGKSAIGIHEYIGIEPLSYFVSKHEPTSGDASFSSLLVPGGVYSLIPSSLHPLQRVVVLSTYTMLVKREVEQQMAHWSYDDSW